TNYELYAQPAGGRFAGWFADGDAFALGVGGAGDFLIGPTNLTILHEPTVNDSVLSPRLEGSLRSPGFEIKHPYVNVLAACHPSHSPLSRFVMRMRSSKPFKFGNPTPPTIPPATRLISHFLISSSKSNGLASPSWERRHPCRRRACPGKLAPRPTSAR